MANDSYNMLRGSTNYVIGAITIWTGTRNGNGRPTTTTTTKSSVHQQINAVDHFKSKRMSHIASE